MRHSILALVLVAGFLGTDSLAADLRWTRYKGVESCVIDYPTSLFHPEAVPPGKPLLFSSRNVEIFFRIQGVANTGGWSPQRIREKYLSADIPGDLTYDRVRSNFVVLSGHRGTKIFYTKVALSPDRDSACILEITYPRLQKKMFDRIVTRMSRSLRSVN